MEETITNLKSDNERLRQMNGAKTDIISVGAHQIRTSLSGLKWIIKMFIDGDLGQLSPEQENLLRKAYDSNERAINLVTELLLANKTEDIVEKTYKFDKINLTEIIDSSLFDFSGETHAKGIEIIFLKPITPIPKVSVDKEKMHIVIQNLLDNAIKYSDTHGKIFITIKNTDDQVQISIKNNGIMIPDESKGEIFKKFYRAPEAQEKSHTGSGIGLFIIKNIIEKHGGKIWFESSKNEGTTFFVNIPINNVATN
ncbi:MAG: HAMP domain-containing histidine kinase [bacterium]|nr:HAMP domain-containing histidine kinase [bacterium]